MNFRLIAVTLFGIAVSGVCSASSFGTQCQSCTPFNYSSASVQQAAVLLASSNSAAIGDTLQLCKDINNGRSLLLSYTVNSSPVTSIANLTHGPLGQIILDVSCDGN